MSHSADKLAASNIDFHECIGEGGFGAVRRITFKTPYKEYKEAASKTVVYDLAQKEVEVMCKLHHPNIVNLIGICEIPGANLILMEYAPNGSLHDYLKDTTKPLPYDLQKKWAMESALAIEYLHGHNYLHRDIKPQNCLLFEDNILKLCDFGLAREIEQSQTTSSQKGTYRYMAPEIHRGNDRGRAVYSKPGDIWAYGMLLLEICTRKPPYQKLGWPTVVLEIVKGTKPSIPDGCPPNLAAMMKQCWKDDPKQRPTIVGLLALLSTSDWSTKREIHPGHEGKQLDCHRIACCPNGDMVISDYNQCYLFDGDGIYKMQLTSTETDPDRKIGYVHQICVSPLGYIFVVNERYRFIHVFTVEGKYLNCFTTVDNPKTSVILTCLAIDREGRLFVGDRDRDIITVNKHPDWLVVNMIKYSLGYNAGIVLNSKYQILIHSNPRNSSTATVYSKVVAIDHSGNEMFSFTPTIDEDIKTGRRVVPCGIVCDDDDNIYVVMMMCANKTAVYNTGHIHRYNPTGVFLQCIDRGLYCPLDLSIKPDGSLVVANRNSIMQYSVM